RHPCVVCGRKTGEMVRPMGAITQPIWCCHVHDDRTIVRAWIHSLPEWHQLQAEFPSDCAACTGPCHCDEQQPVGHRCACWPPSGDEHVSKCGGDGMTMPSTIVVSGTAMRAPQAMHAIVTAGARSALARRELATRSSPS